MPPHQPRPPSSFRRQPPAAASRRRTSTLDVRRHRRPGDQAGGVQAFQVRLSTRCVRSAKAVHLHLGAVALERGREGGAAASALGGGGGGGRRRPPTHPPPRVRASLHPLEVCSTPSSRGDCTHWSALHPLVSAPTHPDRGWLAAPLERLFLRCS